MVTPKINSVLLEAGTNSTGTIHLESINIKLPKTLKKNTHSGEALVSQ